LATYKSSLGDTFNSGALGALEAGAGTVLVNAGRGCLVGGGITAIAGLELGPLDFVAAGGGCVDGLADAVVGGSPGLVLNGVIGGATSMAHDAVKATYQYRQSVQACKSR